MRAVPFTPHVRSINFDRPSRTCWTVSAGVYFFSPAGFLHQEPGGDERERLMMMPADPIANLVVGQSRLALSALEAFFNPMLRLGHARELGQRRLDGSVGEIVIVLPRAVVFRAAQDHQSFLRAEA